MVTDRPVSTALLPFVLAIRRGPASQLRSRGVISWLRRRRVRKAQRVYDAALPLAQQWDHAMSFIDQRTHGLLYITRVRQNAQRGQKVYLQLAHRSGNGWTMGYGGGRLDQGSALHSRNLGRRISQPTEWPSGNSPRRARQIHRWSSLPGLTRRDQPGNTYNKRDRNEGEHIRLCLALIARRGARCAIHAAPTCACRR